MRCPACGTLEDRVVDSRAAEDGSSIRRRRQCERCGQRFTTFERVEAAVPVVVKRDGRTVPFDRSRIEAGVRAACKGRPVDAADVDALVSRVEDRLPGLGSEVESAQIGAFALEELRRLDAVAAVRFASVYKSFQAPEDFEREIQLLSESPDGPGSGSG
ncbi:MAG: transcriptional regulator NrdR [Microthrixaceae bacterium]